ncbi:hypothetical protein Tco_0134536 [Tanacetum coccineum]
MERIHGYGHLKEMLLNKHKLFNLEGEDLIDLGVGLGMFTRSIIIQKRVEDVQLSVESYQRKLNISKPQKLERRIMRSLEVLVSARKTEKDRR